MKNWTNKKTLKEGQEELVFKEQKSSFPHRTVDIWNGLKEEVATATNMHKLKEMLDIWRYGDRTL